MESIQNIAQDDYFIKKTGRSIFLKRMGALLKELGNPHLGVNYIHIGGTSGKGSVANMIQSILTQAGYKTGLFTSPYPTTSIEKIKINKQLISPDEFAKLTEKIKPAVDRVYLRSPYGRPSYFEIFTAIGFLYFKQHHCDYVVLEVGLGGRHDATNIIPQADITVINRIGYDHTEILGKTLSQIAKEKAAIIKPRTIFFTTNQNSPKVLNIFKEACRKNQVPFNVVKTPTTRYQLKLLGEHQQDNAQIAEQVARYLKIDNQTIRTGLSKVKMSCRTEIIQTKPLVILDGAHNQSKIKTTLQIIDNLTYQKLYLIIALTNERNATEIFKEISTKADQIIITRHLSPSRRCYPPKKIAAKLKSKKPIMIFLDPFQALKQALNQANKNDLILVTGSFYLAGLLRQHWRDESKILTERKI